MARMLNRVKPGREAERADVPRLPGGLGKRVVKGVAERGRAPSELPQTAERDPLTNLHSRRRLHQELARMLADGPRRGEGVGLLLIDLDGFKRVNDRCGRQVGDELLVRLETAVGAVVRRDEMFLRTLGDEFAILVPSATAPELVELARRVTSYIASLRFTFGDETVAPTASLGIAFSLQQGGGPEGLVGAADRATDVAKTQGGNRWEFAPAESHV